MSNEEIRAKIDFNNKKIQESFNPSEFILNDEISLLLKMNEDLREVCCHEFIDGVCKWCDEIEV